MIAGDDFQLIEASPAANGAPRREPGVYVRGGEVYYVTRQQQMYLLRRAGEPQLPRELKALPDGCRLLPRADWDGALRSLADAAEGLARR